MGCCQKGGCLSNQPFVIYEIGRIMMMIFLSITQTIYKKKRTALPTVSKKHIHSLFYKNVLNMVF